MQLQAHAGWMNRLTCSRLRRIQRDCASPQMSWSMLDCNEMLYLFWSALHCRQMLGHRQEGAGTLNLHPPLRAALPAARGHLRSRAECTRT